MYMYFFSKKKTVYQHYAIYIYVCVLVGIVVNIVAGAMCVWLHCQTWLDMSVGQPAPLSEENRHAPRCCADSCALLAPLSPLLAVSHSGQVLGVTGADLLKLSSRPRLKGPFGPFPTRKVRDKSQGILQMDGRLPGDLPRTQGR